MQAFMFWVQILVDGETSSNIGNKESLPDSQIGSQTEFSPSSRKYELAVGNEAVVTAIASAENDGEQHSDANVIR